MGCKNVHVTCVKGWGVNIATFEQHSSSALCKQKAWFGKCLECTRTLQGVGNEKLPAAWFVPSIVVDMSCTNAFV